MKKKIFLGVGSLFLATTSTMAVVSCDPKTPAKQVEKYKGESAIGDLIHEFLPNLLKDNEQKENILANVDKILAGGISKVKDADLKAILKSFKVSDSLSGIILKVLKSDLLERIFVKGFADIQTEYKTLNSKYQEAEDKYKLALKEADAATSDDEKKQKQEQAKKDLDNAKKIFNDAKKESVKTFVESVLDAPQEGDIFTRELLTKLLVGFDNKKDIEKTFGVDPSVSEGDAALKFIVNFLKGFFEDKNGSPIKISSFIKKGLFQIDKNQIKNTFDSINIIFGQFGSMIKQYAPKNIMSTIEKVLSSYKNIEKEKFAQSIQSLIHGGLKSLKGKDNEDLITFIEYVSGQKDIPIKTPTSSTSAKQDKDPSIVKMIANILINKGEDIYTFLKYGFSKDNWKELDGNLLKYLIPLIPEIAKIAIN